MFYKTFTSQLNSISQFIGKSLPYFKGIEPSKLDSVVSLKNCSLLVQKREQRTAYSSFIITE